MRGNRVGADQIFNTTLAAAGKLGGRLTRTDRRHRLPHLLQFAWKALARVVHLQQMVYVEEDRTAGNGKKDIGYATLPAVARIPGKEACCIVRLTYIQTASAISCESAITSMSRPISWGSSAFRGSSLPMTAFRPY